MLGFAFLKLTVAKDSQTDESTVLEEAVLDTRLLFLLDTSIGAELSPNFEEIELLLIANIVDRRIPLTHASCNVGQTLDDTCLLFII